MWYWLLFLFFQPLMASQTAIREDARAWAQALMEKQVNSSSSKDACKTCRQVDVISGEQAEWLVFVSFSMPVSLWLSIDAEMAQEGMVFVLKGLPEDDFSQFAQELFALKQQGLKATVRLDPASFEHFDVVQVPTFVKTRGKSYDKVAGAVGRDYLKSLLEDL